MIPADIDASLRAGESLPEQLDDGFSPPSAQPAPQRADAALPEPALGAQSLF